MLYLKFRMDTIFVENLSISGRHGVMSHEWSHEQQFIVDMKVTFDTKKSAETDQLVDSINYADLCSIAKTILQGESVYLVEKLADMIAVEILKDKRIRKVEVTVKKPTVLPSGIPGVTIMREQKD